MVMGIKGWREGEEEGRRDFSVAWKDNTIDACDGNVLYLDAVNVNILVMVLY